MATAAYAYGHAPYYAMLGNWSWTVSTINCGMFTSTGYIPDIDNHVFLSDLSGEVITGSYTRQTLISKTLTYDATSNSVQGSAAQVQWTGLTAVFQYIAFWADTGTPTTSPLLFYIDYGADQSVTAGTWTLPVPTTGYLTATV